MKVIVCFGDSNTWGYDPDTTGRFAPDVRWTGVLQKTLGDGYKVVEEGLNGRTTVWDDPIEEHKNGKTYLYPCLQTHKPFDLITIMLGTNDLKHRFSLPAFDIAEGAGRLVQIVQNSDVGIDGAAPKVLLMAPPPLAKLTDFDQMFAGATEKAARFAEEYARVANELGCAFLDTSQHIVSSDLDGIHFEADEHRKLGEAVAQKIVSLLG